MQVQSGGVAILCSSMPPCVIPGPVDSASAPPSSGRGNYLPTQSQASYHSASSSPLARRTSSGFDGVYEEANVRANVTVADGHADIGASAVKTDDEIDDNADEDDFNDTHGEALGALFRATPSLDLDLPAFLAPLTQTSTSITLHFSLHSLPSPLPSPLLLLLLRLLLGSPSEIQEFLLS